MLKHSTKPKIKAVWSMVVATALSVVVSLAPPVPALASGTTICTPPAFTSAWVTSGRQVMQTDEFGSSSVLCLNTDGLGQDMQITQANMSSSSVVAYPSLFKGCHWSNCSSSTYNFYPLKLSAMNPGDYDWQANVVNVPGTYSGDIAWDVWINQDSTAGQTCNNCGNSSEMMVWLKQSGTQPAGSKVASGVSIGGHTYDVWYRQSGTTSTTTYVLTPAATILDIDPKLLLRDMINRGYTNSAWYIISAEFGMEIKSLSVPPSGNQLKILETQCSNLTGTC